MFKKKPEEPPVPIGKIAVVFRTGPVEAWCETDLLGHFTVNVDDPTNPIFDPDFSTLRESIQAALRALTSTVDDDLIQSLLDQLHESRAEEG